MELIYLYINSFRNLQNVGFNFSPYYKANYTGESKRLEIERTNSTFDYNFFGSNITNITGVVGMNSSGKSNLLDLICLLTKGGRSKIDSSFILLFQNKLNRQSELMIKTNINDLSSSIEFLETFNPAKAVPNLSVVYFSNVSDGRDSYFSKDVIDLSQNGDRHFINQESEVHKQIKFLLSDYREEVQIDAPKGLLISNRIFRSLNVNRVKAIGTKIPVYEDLHKRYRRLKSQTDSIDFFRYTYRFSILTYLLNQIVKNGKNYIDVRDFSEFDSYGDVINEIMNNKLLEAVSGNFAYIHERISDIIEELVTKFDDMLKLDKRGINTMLSFDKVVEDLRPELYNERFAQKTYFYFHFDARAQSIFKKYIAIFDFPEIIDVEWVGISSGHKAFLNIFSQFHSVIRRVGQHDNILICIDEGDLYLHPEWQREFLNRLVTFVPLILRRQLQFILTTHSPFLVSDLPRENLILLKPKEDYCIIVPPEESMSRTFGANIVDLFMKSFFLTQGTISEFSLNKIRNAITIALDDHASKSTKDRARSIANLIGDDIIQDKLLKILDNVKDR